MPDLLRQLLAKELKNKDLEARIFALENRKVLQTY